MAGAADTPATFPVPPPLFSALNFIVPGTGRLTQQAAGFLQVMWAAIQGQDGILERIQAIYDNFLEIPLPAGVALSGHRVVTVKASGELAYPSIDDLTDGQGVIGMTLGAATAAGTIVRIQVTGRIEEPSWDWIPGLPLYCLDQGVLSQTAPVDAGDWVLPIGVALNQTAILFGMRSLVLLA